MNSVSSYGLSLTLFLFLMVPASPTLACVIIAATEAEERIANQEARLKSKPVNVRPDCSFSNAGLSDVSAGPVKALGNNRIYQVLGENRQPQSSVLVADCSSREVVRISRIEIESVTCLTLNLKELPILKPEGPFSMGEGGSLAELKSIVKQDDFTRIDEKLAYLLEDDLGKPLPKKDRLDLLCGCKVHYPDSRGAKK